MAKKVIAKKPYERPAIKKVEERSSIANEIIEGLKEALNDFGKGLLNSIDKRLAEVKGEDRLTGGSWSKVQSVQKCPESLKSAWEERRRRRNEAQDLRVRGQKLRMAGDERHGCGNDKNGRIRMTAEAHGDRFTGLMMKDEAESMIAQAHKMEANADLDFVVEVIHVYGTNETLELYPFECTIGNGLKLKSIPAE